MSEVALPVPPMNAHFKTIFQVNAYQLIELSCPTDALSPMRHELMWKGFLTVTNE